MASNFDNTFEKNKLNFKKKFGKEWNANIQEYLTFLQILYLSALTEISNNGLGQIKASIDDLSNKINNLKK